MNIRLKKLIPTLEEWREWQYRFHERLGILAGSGPTTLEQEDLARSEADEWLENQPLKTCMDEFDNPAVEPVIDIPDKP